MRKFPTSTVRFLLTDNCTDAPFGNSFGMNFAAV